MKSNWYLIGEKHDSGRDELWLVDDYDPIEISPPHIQGKDNFIEDINGLFDNQGRKLARRICNAIENTENEVVEGKKKLKILTTIDKTLERETGIPHHYRHQKNLIIYHLKL